MDPRLEKQRLFDQVPLDPQVVEDAIVVRNDALRKVALGHSVIASVMLGLMHQAWTGTVDRVAVKLTGDGNPMLLLNPGWLVKVGSDALVFALVHEAGHLMHQHLSPVVAELSRNQNWITATESCINYDNVTRLRLPLIQEEGAVLIVDPFKVYDRYREQARKDGLTPATREQFFSTDLSCFSALEGLSKPVTPKGLSGCVHASQAQQGQADGFGGMLDPEQVGKFMDKVLQGAIQAAKNGRQGAKEEILFWMDATPEAKAWGDLGAGVLRGETTRSRKTDLWERWTSDAIATRMAEGNRMRYNAKVWWDPRVSPRGRQPRKHGSVFVDASGSMHQSVLDRVAGLIGDLDNIDVQWHSFDGAVWPFTLGEPFKGGGGTSFQVIADHVADGSTPDEQAEPCCGELDPDFVLVITDGYAPQIEPPDSNKWIWLIVPGGDPWPSEAGMSCRQIDEELAAAA